VWKVRRATGERVRKRPAATKRLSGNGAWGPFRLERGARYEFAITRPASGTHHLYYEPFRHDDHLVRLLTAEPNTGLDALTEKSDRHSVVIVTRNKELWGDQAVEARNRPIRLRRGLGRRKRPERAAAGVLRAAVHQRRRPRDPGCTATVGPDLDPAEVAGQGTCPGHRRAQLRVDD
jgi:Lipase C-terminal domain